MNPTTNEQAGLNLPPPIMEQPGTVNPGGETAPAQPEVPAAAPERATGPSSQMPAPAMPLPPPTMPQPTTGGTNTDVSITTQVVVPDSADDGDLIEKEWVNKAKQIVERNREDPYRQSSELTVVKADYMKKRYNKTLKVGE